MLKSITLRFGPGEGEEALSFSPGPMTVFVGPNNSGKSLALRELESFIESGGEHVGYIVGDLEPDLPGPDDYRPHCRSLSTYLWGGSTEDPAAPLPP